MTKKELQEIEEKARDYGLKDFKSMNPKTIPIRQWVRNKCIFGCWRYGCWGTCPPELPSIPECARFFQEYRGGLFIHFAEKLKDPEMRHAWSRKAQKNLVALEREVFLSGYYKAFVFPPATCCLCDACKGPKKACRHPHEARPNLEGFGVDVYATAWKMGYPVQVLKGYKEEMNRFALLLVE